MRLEKMTSIEFCQMVNEKDLIEENVFRHYIETNQDQVIYHYYHPVTRRLIGVYHDIGPAPKSADYFRLIY